MRRLLCLLPLTLLAACENKKSEELEFERHVLFSQPFPQFAHEETKFPARLRGVYQGAEDTTLQLCIGTQAVWEQRLGRTVLSEQELAAEKPELRIFDSWQTAGNLRYYLHRRADDSIAATIALPDTLFGLAPAGAWRLRRFQGGYYLSRANDPHWRLRRLVLAGGQLRLEKVGFDTLRLAILPPGLLRRPTDSLGMDWVIGPATRRQARLLAQSAGLWETLGTYERR